ncbi:MAG: hypothetical protein KGJ44_04150 [Betaproteobacteria bacterium]|nr:hypothetical protein [Betaproteobacteria bacterium]
MPRVTPPPAPLTQPRRQSAVLAIVLVSYLMIVLDISIVITALPKISLSLHMTPIALTWVQSAYTLTFGGLLLLGARAGGMLLAALGMAALSQVTPHTPYLLGVALPMLVIGIGQGATLSPLTLYGISGVAAQDAGATSGLVNVFHQLGSSLGLGVLAVVFASAAGGGDAPTALTHHIASAFAASALLLAAAWAVAMALIVRPGLRRLQPQPA